MDCRRPAGAWARLLATQPATDEVEGREVEPKLAGADGPLQLAEFTGLWMAR